MEVKQKRYFNSTRDARDILYLFSYISVPDIFIRKLFIDLINNYNKTKNCVSCFIQLKKGHLFNREFKTNFIELNKVIFDHLNLREDQRNLLMDDLIVKTDNASETLVVFYEFNNLTTTITFVSKVVDYLEQTSIHTRNFQTSTHYLPVTLTIFETISDYAPDIYKLKTKEYLDTKISEWSKIEVEKPTEIAIVRCPNSRYIGRDKVHMSVDKMKSHLVLMRSTAVQSLIDLTGFDIREEIKPNYDSDGVFLMKDKNGYYIRLGKD